MCLLVLLFGTYYDSITNRHVYCPVSLEQSILSHTVNLFVSQ